PAPDIVVAHASTVLYPLSLHDARPILLEDRAGGRLAAALQEAVDQPRRGLGVVDGDGEPGAVAQVEPDGGARAHDHRRAAAELQDRKSTRLNSSHVKTSYAVFCLKKKT